MIGVITGSGIYELDGMRVIERMCVETPYGEPSGDLVRCELGGVPVFFLARHGPAHTIPPHRVNYRANVWALKQVGVQRIVSVSAVGGIRGDLSPGCIVTGGGILDFTKSRGNTFFDGPAVAHVDFSSPYCEDMRGSIAEVARKRGECVLDGLTYVAVEGPRLETAAEIAFFRSAGADVVGMTAMPEAALAREAELCYLGIYVVTNFAAGISESKLTAQEVLQVMQRSSAAIASLLSEALPGMGTQRRCRCGDALRDAML